MGDFLLLDKSVGKVQYKKMSKLIIRSKEEIIRTYLNTDLSLEESAKKLNCSVTVLRRLMKSCGIKAKSRVRFGVRKGAKFAILGNKEWLREQLVTKSFRDLAKEIGTTEGNISDRVKRYGLRPVDWTHSLYSKQGLKKKYPNGRYGELSSNWKNGITTLYNLIRQNVRSKKWMKFCLERDNYTCQGCGQKGGNLEVHHKKQLAKIIKDNKIKTTKDALRCKEVWDTNNGIVLCVKCHRETENHSNKDF